MVRLIISGIQYVRITSLRYSSTKPKAVLNDATFDLLSNEKIVHRKQPGIIKPRTPEFPKWAIKAIKDVLKEKPISLKQLKETANKMVCHLNKRHPPLEHSELPKKLVKIENQLNINNVNDEKISIEDVDFRRDRKARNIYKQHVYNWQPINFDMLTSLTYLAARAVQNYAVLYKILQEIKVRDEDFKPETLFDFGSGVGTVTWAASQIWPESLKEYYCIEASESMIELSEKLAKSAKPQINNIFYRQYFPASINPTYDITVSAYSLFELPSVETRLETILKLWKKANRYLVIVEEGTNAGFKLVNEARDFILNYANARSKRSSQYAHVFSPCPHDLACPRLKTDNTPCNFAVLYHPLQFLGGQEHKSEFYSYVILKKGKRPTDDEQWPRIVRDTLKRSRHVICRMCIASGNLKEEIFTDNKHGRHMYRCARSSEWGDRLPMHYQEQQEISEADDVTDSTTIIK